MKLLFRQLEYNINKSHVFQPVTALPASPPDRHAVRLIAYYLPQFHAIPENDGWWGPGFTEWTNVTRAMPRFLGHYQPRRPADLGFYDLSSVQAIRRQADLARRAGIYGFCFHNYWFSGKPLLDTPIEILLSNPDIDLRFCINWANESWSRTWDGQENHVLMKQEYNPGEDLLYAKYISKFVADRRYIRIDGRPLIMIYRPERMPDASGTVRRWREFFVAAGLGNPYVIMPQAFGDDDPRAYGMDAAAGFPPHRYGWGARNLAHSLRILDRRFRGAVLSFDEIVARSDEIWTDDYIVFPGVMPAWDNEARRPNRSISVVGSTPRKFGDWLKSSAERVISRNAPDERIVFINAWNEWAEGAYLEPDQHHGAAYLKEVADVLAELNGEQQRAPHSLAERSPFGFPKETLLNLAVNAAHRAVDEMTGYLSRKKGA